MQSKPKTPILFIIFNRPKLTAQTFNAIKQYKPERLYIAADGPRNKNDENLCAQTRELVKLIDWPCVLEKRFQEKNLGCRKHVSSAINWFFDNNEQGIILEDDCLPHPDFFDFCSEMLDKYKNVREIMHINGSCFHTSKARELYFFSNIASIWGWASWKRAWQTNYDVNMTNLEQFIINKTIEKIGMSCEENKFWTNLFNKIKRDNVDTWDSQWQFAIFNKQGICITPNFNLIKNIGFGPEATHTKEKNPRAEINMASDRIKEIIHPKNIMVSREKDFELFNKIYKISLFDRLKSFLKKII